MKRLITAIAICGLLAPGAAYAVDVYDWTGNSNPGWKNSDNWSRTSGTGSEDYPGKDSDTDDAVIDDTNRNPVTLPSALPGPPYTIVNLDMRNGTSGTPVSIRINNGITLEVTGALTVDESTISGNESYVEKVTADGTIAAATCTITGGDTSGENVTFKVSAGTVSTTGLFKIADSNAAAYAELWVTSTGTVSPNSMELAGDARLDLDANMTVTGECKIIDGFDRPQAGGVNLATDVTLTCGSIVFDGSTNGFTFNPTLASGASIVTN